MLIRYVGPGAGRTIPNGPTFPAGEDVEADDALAEQLLRQGVFTRSTTKATPRAATSEES